MAIGTVKPNGQHTALATTADPRYQKLRSILEMSKGQIGQIVSKMISADELVRLFLNAACKMPDLLQCAEDTRGVASIGLALMKAAAMGLKPDGRNGHLLPFKNRDGWMECQFFPDYKGMVKLMCLSPKVATVNGGSIRANDQWDCSQGTNEFLHFKKAMQDRGELIGAFAYYTTPTGQTCFRILNTEEISQRQKMSKSFSGKYPQYSPWTIWPDEMWAKSALHDLAKVAPLGEAFERAVQIDQMDEAGAMTESDLRALSHNSAPRTIEHHESDSGFEPQGDDRRQMEPASKSQERRQTGQKEAAALQTPRDLFTRLQDTSDESEIRDIENTANDMVRGGQMSQAQRDELAIMCNDARKI